MAKNATKLKLMKIWEILSQDTDENNPISSVELMQKLQEAGIPCDRKTLYTDIETLNEFGYEVLSKRSSRNEYYVMERKFNVPELKILLDGVQGASFLSKKKTKEFERKIASLAGSKKAEVLKKNIVEFNPVKSSNERIYYNVDTVVEAIMQGKKLEFYYFNHDCNHKRVYRRDHERYAVDPYATVFARNNYYLIAYSFHHDKVSFYRIDRMDQVSVSEQDITTDPKAMAEEIDKKKRGLFGMYPADEAMVEFQATNDLTDVVFDTFGEKAKLYPLDENTFGFVQMVQLSPQFYGWCCSFGEKLKIVSPPHVVDEMKNLLAKLSKRYLN